MNMTRTGVLAASLAMLVTASALATEHGHEHADETVDDATLQEAKRAYHARRAQRAIQFRSNHGGVLAGKRIGVSAGHGIIWSSDAQAWLFQRSTEAYSWGGIREDIHTAQLVIDYLLPMIERAGGETVSMRERSYVKTSTVVDNDSPEGGTYAEEGTWETGESEGYGSTYRYAYLDPRGQSKAKWSFTVPDDGVYPVYAYVLSSENRASDATYAIQHATGLDEVTLDQSVLRPDDWPFPSYPNIPPGSEASRRYNDLWHHLGNFPFRAGETYQVSLTALGDDPEQVVIADAIHIGGGVNAAPGPDGSFSGRARWEEGAMSYLRWLGAPDWVFVGDVTARPLYSVYQGVDAYMAVHTNCCNSQGTSTWIWYPEMYIPRASWPSNYAANNLPPGTLELALNVHGDVMKRARETWKSDWPDGGIVGANFGELRPFQKGWYEDVYTYGADNPLSIPAMLIEFAFHDTDHDSRYIREEGFRHDVARGMFTGLVRSLEGSGAVIPPLPPAALHAQVAGDTLQVRWQEQPDPLEPDATATGYRVYTSTDGLLWSREPIEVAGTEAAIPLDQCEPLFVRVTAVNEGGESLDSPVVGARQGFTDGPRVLYVDGVDRELRTEEDPNNDRAWGRVYLPAILAAQPGATIDATTDDDVARITAERSYDLVVWATGQTSTREQSLTATDRDVVEAVLRSGATLILSGAELVWEHVAVGDDATTRFARETLGVDYVSDDADTTTIDASALGLGVTSFGDCSADSPCMPYPDVIAPLDGGTVLASYPDGGAAIVESPQGVIMGGFPLESIAPPRAREEFIATLVMRGLDGVAPGSGECPAPADTDDTGGTGSPDAGGPTWDGGNSQPGTDGGSTADGGEGDVRRINGTGCGCTTARSGPAEAVLLLALLGLVSLRRARP